MLGVIGSNFLALQFSSCLLVLICDSTHVYTMSMSISTEALNVALSYLTLSLVKQWLCIYTKHACTDVGLDADTVKKVTPSPSHHYFTIIH